MTVSAQLQALRAKAAVALAIIESKLVGLEARVADLRKTTTGAFDEIIKEGEREIAALREQVAKTKALLARGP